MNKLCSLVGGEIGKELLSLFMEYEEQKTSEAKSVKDLDKFDMLFQAYEYEYGADFGLDLQDFFTNIEGFHTKTVLSWFQDLQYLRSKRPSGTYSTETKILKVFDLFFLTGNLKHTKLTIWNPKESIEYENVADHVYRTSIMAFLLDDGTSSGLNFDKCIKMVLIKDTPMSASDFSKSHHLSKEEIDLDNMKIMQRICGCLGEKLNKEFLDLFKEYQEQQTPEAKLVKDLEEFEYLLHAYEYKTKADTKLQLPTASNHSFGNPEVSKWVKELQILENETKLPCST